jgi:segregation and condensation protein A
MERSSTAVPNRLSSHQGEDAFLVELDRFSGPLELLLHLIRSQDIDIFDIPISQITRQFQAVIEAGIEDLELDRAGEFLELAATLIRIKAQLLLPRPDDVQWDEDPRAELVRRLLEYELFQEVAGILGGAEAERRRHFGKGYLSPRRQPEEIRGKLTTTLAELIEVACAIPEADPVTTHVVPTRVVTVEEKMSAIRTHLNRSDRLLFSRLFGSWREREHVVAALLACLELARQQVLRIEQVKRFGFIWLFRGSNRKKSGSGFRTTNEVEPPHASALTDSHEIETPAELSLAPVDS